MSDNAAAPAVRSQTTIKSWAWDFHFDALGRDAGNNFDSNGVEDDSNLDARPQLMRISVCRIHRRCSHRSRPHARTATIQFHLARSFLDGELTAGPGLRVG